MAEDEILIERILKPGSAEAAGIARILPLLSTVTPPSLEELQGITSNPWTYLYVARLAGEIVGSLTLATFHTPTGRRGWIEDVVVDEAVQGRGIASKLVHHALDQARELDIRSVELTSRPSREAANRLYQRLGFSQRETNVYRFNFEIE